MQAGSDWKEHELSSGVVVLYGPFPSGMYWDIQAKALEEHPDPEVPTKTIDVVDGTEEVDDPDDPEYKAKLEKARLGRWNKLGEAALEFAMVVKGGLEPWREIIQSIAESFTTDPLPEAENKQKAWFLAKYAMRTPEDWKLIRKIQRFSQIEEDDVRQRVESFPGDVAGPEGDGVDAPGAAQE